MAAEPVVPIDYARTGGEQVFSREALREMIETVLARGAAFRFEARGWSMAPFIHDGDRLTLSPLSGAPRPGDVLGFLHAVGDRLIVHRVIGRAAGGWLMQGDNVFAPDGVVPEDRILGRVTRVERGSRAVRLGLGPERVLIAWMSSHHLLKPAAAAAQRSRRRGGRVGGCGG